MIHYLWWIPAAMILYGLIGWLSYKNNISNGKLLLVSLILIQMIPVWAIVTKVSKRLLFDALLYDIIAFLACNLTIAYFTGVYQKFSITQTSGFVMVVVGFILMRLKF